MTLFFSCFTVKCLLWFVWRFVSPPPNPYICWNLSLQQWGGIRRRGPGRWLGLDAVVRVGPLTGSVPLEGLLGGLLPLPAFCHVRTQGHVQRLQSGGALVGPWAYCLSNPSPPGSRVWEMNPCCLHASWSLVFCQRSRNRLGGARRSSLYSHHAESLYGFLNWRLNVCCRFCRYLSKHDFCSIFSLSLRILTPGMLKLPTSSAISYFFRSFPSVYLFML